MFRSKCPEFRQIIEGLSCVKMAIELQISGLVLWAVKHDFFFFPQTQQPVCEMLIWINPVSIFFFLFFWSISICMNLCGCKILLWVWAKELCFISLYFFLCLAQKYSEGLYCSCESDSTSFAVSIQPPQEKEWTVKLALSGLSLLSHIKYLPAVDIRAPSCIYGP